jgi:hypothetical protein
MADGTAPPERAARPDAAYSTKEVIYEVLNLSAQRSFRGNKNLKVNSDHHYEEGAEDPFHRVKY